MQKHLMIAGIGAGVWLTAAMLPAQETAKPAAGGPTTMEAEFVSPAKGNQKLNSVDGNWKLPPGTYDVKAYRLKKTAGGSTVILKGTRPPPSWRKMDSFQNQTFELKFGAPLVLSVEVDVHKNLLKCHVWLTGSEGETYLPVAMKLGEDGKEGGQVRTALKLKFVDESGNLLGAKTVACEPDGVCAGTWSAPEGFQGRVKVEVETEMAPFDAQWEPKFYEVRYEGPPEKISEGTTMYSESKGGGDAAGGEAGGAPAKAADPMEGILQTQIEFVANGQSKVMTGTTGSWELPRGTVDIKSFCLIKIVNGNKNMLKGVAAPSKFSKMDVINTEPKEIKFGKPLTVTKSASIKKKKVDLSISLVGAEGETYVPALIAGAKAPAGPKYAIKDESDKVLSTGTLNSRADGTCVAVWSAPGNFKGKFKIDVEIKDLTDVFEVTQEENKWFMMP